MRLQLAYIIACLTAGGSFLLNRALLKIFGVHTVFTLSPVVEEMLKTVLAYSFDADILITHISFGLIEAVYDWVQTRRLVGVVLSVVGHGLFGFATLLVIRAAGVYVGLAAGIVSHLLWNTVMLKFLAPQAQ